MRRLTLLAAAVVALGVAGPQALGKLALAAGLPGLAAQLISLPGVKGVALFRKGNYLQADLAFAASGQDSTYNRGLSLAATGNYALSRAYFDAVLFANPADSQARDNRNVVAALAPQVIGEGNESGRVATRVVAPPVATFAAESRPLGEGRRVADDAWLATLPDDPGEFLRLRLADEHGRRLTLGLAPPDERDPW